MWWQSRDDIIRKRFERARAVSIASFGDGTLGKIIGRVRCAQTVRAPISGRPCSYYEVSHMRLQGSVWVEYNRQIWGTRFYVADGTGEAVIDTEFCDVLLLPDYDRRQVTSYASGWGDRQLEGILAERERVAVIGYGRWEPDPDPGSVSRGYRHHPVKLILRGGSKDRLLITDKPTIVGRS